MGQNPNRRQTFVSQQHCEDPLREKFTQPHLGAILIKSLTFNSRLRDDTEVLGYGLPALWCDSEAQEAALDLIKACDAKATRGNTGHPGLDFWQVRVFAVAKQGLGVDDDRLGNLLSNHRDWCRLAGLSDAIDLAPIASSRLSLMPFRV